MQMHLCGECFSTVFAEGKSSIKNIEDGVEAYYKIAEQIDDKYLEGRRQMTIKHDGEKQVILSCYMKGVKSGE